MKITYTNLLFAVVLFIMLPSLARSQSYSGGSGTASDPYQIATKADLAYLDTHPADWGDSFIQTASITFTTTDFQSGGGFYNGGEGFIPIGSQKVPYTGSYNGDGHTIDGLYINNGDSVSVGMFGEVSGTDTISNIGLTNASINVTTAGEVTVIDCGALVGSLGTGTNTSVVQNCYSTGSVTNPGYYYTGGLIGYVAANSIVSDSYSECSVKCDQGAAAGLVAFLDGKLQNCYARGNIYPSSSAVYLGGLVGEATGSSSSIVNCYSTGRVSGASGPAIGGLVAYESSASATACFWDTSSSGVNTSALGTGESTSQLQTESTFTNAGWDFTNTWQITAGSYPTFQAMGLIATTDVATSIGKLSAQLNGTVSSFGDTVAVRFLYGTTSGIYTDSVSASPATVTGTNYTSVSASLTGLSGGTTYYYVLVLDGGTSYKRGNEVNFSTSSAVWGYDLKFDGSSSYATSYKVVSTDTANVTIDAWVKWDGTTTGGTPLIASNGCADSNGYGLYLYLNNHLSVLVCAVGWLVSDSTLPVNTWTHVALVRSGGNFVLYENGVSLPFGYSGTSSDSATKPLIPASSFFVGGENSSHPDYFPGEIDEVRLSNTARYSSNFTPPTKPFTSDGNTVALYHFNEGSGSVAGDSSGNGNNLTLVSNPTWNGSDNPAGPTDHSLAVQATDFVATSSVGSVTLTWQTQSEVNDAGFEILRQVQGERNTEKGAASWQLISSYTTNDSLVGMGTSSTGRSYDFTDNHVTTGVTYNYKVESVSTNGGTKDLSTMTVTVGVPKTYALYQNYPNPFNPSTTIRFDLKEQSNVTLAIYNVLGQEVEHWDYGMINAGRYNKDINMARFASGVYFYRIIAKGSNGDRFVSIKKMLELK